MSGSWRHKCLLLSLLAFIVLSEASRLPKGYWEQMMPKKLPTPKSSPSKGTNSVTMSSSTAIETDQNRPSSDGKGILLIYVLMNRVITWINVQGLQQEPFVKMT
ncbi:hypothetical protein ACSBR1_001196 [Camellia fascicularis]